MGSEDKQKEKCLEERGLSVRYGCPRFNGTGEEYEDWRMKVEDWLWLTRKEVESPGLVIRPMPSVLQAINMQFLSTD